LKVLVDEPQLWFLLEEDGSLFLDVGCNHSFFGYSFMIQLSPQETDQYSREGRSYLSWLAQDIQDSAPILVASQSKYRGRDVSHAFAEQTLAAVKSWQANRVHEAGEAP